MKLKNIILSAFSLGLLFSTCGCNNTPIYVVTFNSNGGNHIEEIRVAKGTKISRPDNVEKYGYDLTAWTKGTTEWDFENNRVYDNMTLKANWSPTVYEITYDWDGGTSDRSDYQTSYTIEDDFYLPNAYKYDCSFKGWYDQNEAFRSHIEKGSTGDLHLTARYNRSIYYVFFTYFGYNNATIEGKTAYYSDETPDIKIIPNEGYVVSSVVSSKSSALENFQCTENEDGSVSITWKMKMESVFIDITLGLKKYSITYLNLNGATAPTKQTYTIKEEFTLYKAYLSDYDFIKWILEDGTTVSTIKIGTTGDLVVYAVWSKLKCVVSIFSAFSKYATYSGSGTYYYGETCTLKLTDYDTSKYYFVGWYVNEDLISCEETYSFTVTQSTRVNVVLAKISNRYERVLNSHGDLLEESIYNSDGTLSLRINNTYDDQYRVIKTEYTTAASYYYSEYQYCVVDNAQTMLEYYYGINATEPELITWTYYPNGDVKSCIKDINTSDSYHYVNTYDENGYILTKKRNDGVTYLRVNGTYTWNDDYSRCDFVEVRSQNTRNGYSLYDSQGREIYTKSCVTGEIETATSFNVSKNQYRQDGQLQEHNFNYYYQSASYKQEGKRYFYDAGGDHTRGVEFTIYFDENASQNVATPVTYSYAN